MPWSSNSTLQASPALRRSRRRIYHMRHGTHRLERRAVRDLIATTNADHIEPMVRVPATRCLFIARVLTSARAA